MNSMAHLPVVDYGQINLLPIYLFLYKQEGQMQVVIYFLVIIFCPTILNHKMNLSHHSTLDQKYPTLKV